MYLVFLPARETRVKLHLKHKQTDGQRHVRLSGCPFLRCVCQGRGRIAMLHRNLRGGEVKIRDQPISTRNLVSWLAGKSLKLLPLDMWHILRLKCTEGDSCVCPFVSVSVCVLDGVSEWVEFNAHSTQYRSFRRRIHPGSLVHLLFSSGWPAT